MIENKRKEWDNYLKPSGFRLIKFSEEKFLKIILGLFILVVIIESIFLLYMVDAEKFKSISNIELKPLYNSTTNNNYSFNNEVKNDYEHNINLNNTFYINNILPDNICDMCSGLNTS